MSKQSGLLKKHSREIDSYMIESQRIMKQFMLDTLQITLNRYESFGFIRLKRVAENWEKTFNEFFPAIDPKDPECDVKQEHMERIFAEICKDHMKPIPFAARYPTLRGVSYEGRGHKP